MTPKELQKANIDRFEKLLRSETEPARRMDLERVLREERVKGASSYPPGPHDAGQIAPNAMGGRSAHAFAWC